MKLAIFTALIVCNSALASSVTEVANDRDLQSIIDACKRTRASASSILIVCPIARTYTYDSLNDVIAEGILEQRAGLAPKKASAASAAELLIGSFREQAQAFVEDEQAYAELDDVMHELDAYITYASETRGASFYSDDDTYWAPSVNARAIGIVDLKHNRVEVILHGDTDG